MGRDIGFAVEVADSEGVYRTVEPSFAHALRVHRLAILGQPSIPFAYSTERCSEIFFILEGFEADDEHWARLASGRGLPKDGSPEVLRAIAASSDAGYGQPGWATTIDFARYDVSRGYDLEGVRQAYSADAILWLTSMADLLATLGRDARLVFWWF